jgi:hypothetical protein
MSPCCLCGGKGTSQPAGCPSCGRKLPNDVVTQALNAAQEALSAVLHHPGVAISNGRAVVYVGGQVVASVPVLGGDKAMAVRQVTLRALRERQEPDCEACKHGRNEPGSACQRCVAAHQKGAAA